MRVLTTMSKAIEYEQIIAIDIETASDGKLLDIGCFDYVGYRTFQTWLKFFDWLLLNHNGARIIAHNGFGFDFITFNQWFLQNFKRYGFDDNDITYLSSESLLIAMILRHNGVSYTFLDTMRYFPGQSLQKLAESFLGESKNDVPDDFISRMEDYKRLHKKEYYQYLQKDCELLYRIYWEFRDEINTFTNIGELGMSAGSTAMKSFRRWMYTDYPKTRIFASPNEHQAFADYALRGGLTLYIGDGKHKDHYYENVYHYDVISMYPSVMRYVPVPSSPMIYTDKLLFDFGCMRPGWYLCNYKQTYGRVPILFTLTSEYPQWEGQGIFSHFDLQFLQQYGEFEMIDGVCYEDYNFPFEKYFNQLLKIRMEAKVSDQSAKAHALKILANALYGKFGQKSTREVISITSNRDWYEMFLEARLRDYADSGVTEYVVSDDYVLYGVESSSTSFSNRFIGAMVTSIARLKLGLILNTYQSIYCDTDSVFTQTPFDKTFTGQNPGDFEESTQSPNTMICLGKKAYRYGNETKFKGIPARNLTTEDIEAIRYGIEIPVEYKSPTAWKTAIKNEIQNPNKFLPHTRRVKRGKSLCEIGLLHDEADLLAVSETKRFLDSLLQL